MKVTLLLLESALTYLVNISVLLRIYMGFHQTTTVFTVDLEPRNCHVQGNAVQSVTLWRTCAKWDSASQLSGPAALLLITCPPSDVWITTPGSCKLPKEALG